jgi:hypothetical protein
MRWFKRNAIFLAQVLVIALSIALSIPPLTPALAAQSPPQPAAASPATARAGVLVHLGGAAK